MGSDTANDVEEPIRDHTDDEEDVAIALSPSPFDGDGETDGEMTRSEELTAIRESLETLQDVQSVMNERLDLLGREVDDIWMAIRDDTR